MPACPSPTSAATPDFRKCSTGASRRCIRRCTPASSRGATSPSHRDALATHAIPAIDLVVVNLYPFRETVAKPGCTLDEAIENIDIGGPAMVRSAAKNWQHVGVVVDPADYAIVLGELQRNANALSRELRFRLMQRAFSHTAAYDGAIANWLTARDADGAPQGFPQSLSIWPARRCRTCAMARIRTSGRRSIASPAPRRGAIASYRQLQGKELSFNNVADADAAWRCVTRVRRSGVRDRQACESLRRRERCCAARRLPQGVRDRSRFGVRRHHRVQPRRSTPRRSRRSPRSSSKC